MALHQLNYLLTAIQPADALVNFHLLLQNPFSGKLFLNFKVIFKRHRLPEYNNHKNNRVKLLKPILAGILIGVSG